MSLNTTWNATADLIQNNNVSLVSFNLLIWKLGPKIKQYITVTVNLKIWQLKFFSNECFLKCKIHI